MVQVIQTEVRHREIKLRKTFKTALRSVEKLDVIEFVINGNFVGEAVATPVITGDQYEQIEKDLENTKLIGREIENLQEFNSELQQWKICRSAKAAIDMAVHMSCGQISQALNIKSDITVPIAPVSSYPELITERSDFDVFKVKLDRSPIEDSLEKIAIVREIRPDARIRIDPNQSWNVEEAINFVRTLSEFGIDIDYLEQPTPRLDFEALKRIRESSSIPVMADESCFSEEDLRQLIEMRAIDLVNLKILKNGGISEVLRLAHIAQAEGIEVSIGSMMEGEGGVRAAAYVASRISPDYVHDLDAAWWHSNSSIRYRSGNIDLQ